MRPTTPLVIALALCAMVFAPACTNTNRGATDTAPAPTRIEYDLLLRGGTILDGSGRAPFRADVAIDEGRIVAIGTLTSGASTVVLDVSGLVVAPGFIDIHTHADRRALATAVNTLRQGVTTGIDGPDGGGPMRVDDALRAIFATPTAMNLGMYAGFNVAWETVVGQADRRPTPAQIDSMRGMLARVLREGAWGVSAGLDYKPGYFATVDEVVRVVDVARPFRTAFPNHDRVTPETNYSSLAGMRETLVIGERAGLVPVFTHMKLQGHEQGRAAEALAMLDSVGRLGRFAAADVYPYLAGVTGLSAFLIPGWAQDGGRAAMLARFKDPEQRARIAREMNDVIRARFGRPENVFVVDRDANLAQLVSTLGVATVPDAVMLLLEERDRRIVPSFGSEADLVRILAHPLVAVASDCGAGTSMPHPRCSGTYPRALGRYTREQRVASWAGMVHRMSGLPASIVGMIDRGFVAVGMAADLAVFDTATVIDHATYEQRDRPSEGVRHVLVNGRLALRDGEPTGVTAGRPLFRGSSMPSRRPSGDRDRALEVSAANVAIGVRQSQRDRAATGSLRITIDGTTLVATSLGELQTASGWATVSGVGTVAGAPTPFVLTADERDPLDAGRTVVSLTLADRPAQRLVLPAGAIRVTMR